jgi:hypothetical protein
MVEIYNKELALVSLDYLFLKSNVAIYLNTPSDATRFSTHIGGTMTRILNFYYPMCGLVCFLSHMSNLEVFKPLHHCLDILNQYTMD